MTGAARAGAPWLTVVGIGDDGPHGLPPDVEALIGSADVLVGGERHLAFWPDHRGLRIGWRSPLASSFGDLDRLEGRNVVVLASGDPTWYGIGPHLAARYPGAVRIIPSPSSQSLVCAQLGWDQSDLRALSLHGRPLASLRRHLIPDARLVVLSHDGTTPAAVAQILDQAGFGRSLLTVFEHLGGSAERVLQDEASTWSHSVVADLNTIAIHCRASPEAWVHPSIPGLPDEAFESDGLLTKREVRAATLARLMPLDGQRLWDIGAGSGSIAIEWLRAAEGTSAVAIEPSPTRAGFARRNADALGVPGLRVIEGEAPAALADLDPPDAVFLGGGTAAPGVMEAAWAALPRGGRLVANVVTTDGERRLLDWHARHGGDLVRLAISRAEAIGTRFAFRPLMPVTQFAATKR